MPSALDSLLSREMARVAAELNNAITSNENPPFFTWKGNDYQCTFLWNEQSYLNQGGQVPLDDLTIQVLRSEFSGGPIPQLKDIITFTDDPVNTPARPFRVELVVHTPGDYLKIVCYDPAKGS